MTTDHLGIAANVLQVVSFIFGGSVLGWIIKRLNRWIKELVKSVLDEIRASTYPIQKHANGGNSLPDLSKKLDGVAIQVAEIHGSLKTHLQWHNGVDGE